MSSCHTRRALRRAAAIAATTMIGMAATVGTAAAHVTAQPGEAEQGGYTKVSFRTPNEEDAASTTKLAVTLPKDHPISSVSTEPVPGWSAEVEKQQLDSPVETDHGTLTQAVSTITWSGGSIKPGQFQEFSVSLGPLPIDAEEMVFKAIQTYDDGTVVRWIEEPQPGAPEPEHPAPTLALTPPEDAEHASAQEATEQNSATDSGADAGLVLGIVGVVLGLIGAITGGLALRRRSGGSGESA